jgi:hypothetical protein
METKIIQVYEGKKIIIPWTFLNLACLDTDQNFYVLKSKKTPDTLLIIPIGNKYDEDTFEIAETIYKFSSDPLIFRAKNIINVKDGDALKLDIDDFGIFVTKSNEKITKKNRTMQILEELKEAKIELQKIVNKICISGHCDHCFCRNDGYNCLSNCLEDLKNEIKLREQWSKEEND